MTPQEVEAFLQGDRHWFDAKGHAFVLYGLARAMAKKMGPIRMLEIGTREGSLTIPLLAGLTAGHPDACLVSVDNNTDVVPDTVLRARDRVNLYGFERNWEFHLADSREWVSPYQHYHLMMIDADHTYDGVRGDFERYTPLLVKHGLVILHDTESYPDCWRYVQELSRGADWNLATIPVYNGLTLARRKADTYEYDGLFRYVEDNTW